MTLAEVAALYPEPTNVRWLACHAALGRRPRGFEFITWINQQWGRFAETRGIAPGNYAAGAVRDVLKAAADREFDVWLAEQAKEGKTSVN